MNFTNDGWLRQAQNFDKLSHAGGSCLAVCLLWAMLKLLHVELAISMVIIMSLSGGIALELLQGFRGIGFSWRDVVADVVGVLIAYGAIGG